MNTKEETELFDDLLDALTTYQARRREYAAESKRVKASDGTHCYDDLILRPVEEACAHAAGDLKAKFDQYLKAKIEAKS